MNKIPALLLLLALVFPAATKADSDIDAVRKADDARVAATLAGDPAKLNAVFSDDLTYVHSTGIVNHKADFIKVLSNGSMKYYSLEYEAREFQAAAPGLVLMRGRCRARTAKDGKENHVYLGFLAAYRREGGVWRFLAWQSCALTADSPPWRR